MPKENRQFEATCWEEQKIPTAFEKATPILPFFAGGNDEIRCFYRDFLRFVGALRFFQIEHRAMTENFNVSKFQKPKIWHFWNYKRG